MADALDSGSSGSFSCEGSSPFLRIGHKMQDTVNSRVYGVFLCSKIEKGGKKGTPLINDEDVAL